MIRVRRERHYFVRYGGWGCVNAVGLYGRQFVWSSRHMVMSSIHYELVLRCCQVINWHFLEILKIYHGTGPLNLFTLSIKWPLAEVQ